MSLRGFSRVPELPQHADPQGQRQLRARVLGAAGEELPRVDRRRLVDQQVEVLAVVELALQQVGDEQLVEGGRHRRVGVAADGPIEDGVDDRRLDVADQSLGAGQAAHRRELELQGAGGGRAGSRRGGRRRWGDGGDADASPHLVTRVEGRVGGRCALADLRERHVVNAQVGAVLVVALGLLAEAVEGIGQQVDPVDVALDQLEPVEADVRAGRDGVHPRRHHEPAEAVVGGVDAGDQRPHAALDRQTAARGGADGDGGDAEVAHVVGYRREDGRRAGQQVLEVVVREAQQAPGHHRAELRAGELARRSEAEHEHASRRVLVDRGEEQVLADVAGVLVEEAQPGQASTEPVVQPPFGAAQRHAGEVPDHEDIGRVLEAGVADPDLEGRRGPVRPAHALGGRLRLGTRRHRVLVHLHGGVGNRDSRCRLRRPGRRGGLGRRLGWGRLGWGRLGCGCVRLGWGRLGCGVSGRAGAGAAGPGRVRASAWLPTRVRVTAWAGPPARVRDRTEARARWRPPGRGRPGASR